MNISNIYCCGPLLHIVQMAHLFPDSKTFVDMKLKYTPQQTTEDFEEFMAAKESKPTREEIREFVNSHFDSIGKEFVPWSPNDWKDHPAFLDRIADTDMRNWAMDLHRLWKDLGRKMIDDVHENPNYYSIIPVDKPVIVPGGRFMEFYYWDSLWIIRGLLISEMFDTARGMIENFLSIVKRFGLIPNGGRIYYAKRSQPPLLASMVQSYLDYTNDLDFGIQALEMLEHEFEYWMNNQIVEVNGYNVAIYADKSTGPRPESYREDIESANVFASESEKEAHYSELKAAAASGMDFSSRWFINKNGTNEGSLMDLKTRSIVPVELNAILYQNAKIISNLYRQAGNTTKAVEYEAKAQRFLEAIQVLHWCEKEGVWLDYDLINKKQRNYFVVTNLAPLWTKAYDISKSNEISRSVLKYIDKYKLDSYPGGVPNTLQKTGEQWDFPNVWAPMQYMLVQGLENLNTPQAVELSKKWAIRWVTSNFLAYRESGAMFEKYNAETFGGHGGGGEYEVQKGFGWSNGVILEFLVKYGAHIKADN